MPSNDYGKSTYILVRVSPMHGGSVGLKKTDDSF